MGLAIMSESNAQLPLIAREREAARLHQLGLGRLRRGDYPEAVHQFTAALRLAPHDPRTYASRGETHLLQCAYESAIADFTSALELDANSAEVYVQRATAWLRTGAGDRAVRDCDAALHIDTKYTHAYRVRAEAASELGDEDAAVADLSAALELDPRDEESAFRRGSLRVRLGQLKEAIVDFTRTLDLNRYHVLALFERANAHRVLRDHVQALRDYSEVLQLQPSHAEARGKRGLVYKRLGDLKRAVADFTAAIELDQERASNYYHRGLLYRAKGNPAQAEADFDRAVHLQPDYGAALYHRGKMLLARGRAADALVDLDRVVELEPKLPAAYLSRALALTSLDRGDKAHEDAMKAKALDESSAAACLVLGLIHQLRSEWQQAIHECSHGIESNTHLALGYWQRALAYAELENYDKALADCNQLIELEPGNVAAHIQRSAIRHLQGDTQGALADYARALAIEPRYFISGQPTDSSTALIIRRLADLIDGVGAAAPTSQGKQSAETRAPAQAATSVDTTSEKSVRADAAAAEVDAGQITEEIVQDLLAAGSEVKTKVLDTAAPARTATDSPAPGSVQHQVDNAPKTSPCPVCHHNGAPAETVPGGRVRCAQCGALFLPSARPATSIVSALRQEKHVRPPRTPREKNAGASLSPRRWPRPVRIAAAGVAAACVLYLVFPASLLGTTARPTVFPAHGTAKFQGQPLARASLYLHPLGVKDPQFPAPHATVREDGSFVLSTYSEGDGAPAGDYAVTVQWFERVANPEQDDGFMPRNLLPPKYGRAGASGLRLRIQEGDNDLPPINLSQ